MSGHGDAVIEPSEPPRIPRLPLDPVVDRALRETWCDARLALRNATGAWERLSITGSYLAAAVRILGHAVVVDFLRDGAWKAGAMVLGYAGLFAITTMMPFVFAGLGAFPETAVRETIGIAIGLAPWAAYAAALGASPRRPRLFVLVMAGAMPGSAGVVAIEGARALAVVPFIVGVTAGLVLIADRVLLETRRVVASVLAPLTPLLATVLYGRAALAFAPTLPEGGRTVSVGWFFLAALAASWWYLVQRYERRSRRAHT